MATQLDELLESQRKYQQQVANAGQQYTDAVTAANNSYDKLMSDIDARETQAWNDARANYQNNQRRAQMAHNAQLLGDLAHLGVQTWSTGALGGGGNGSNYVLPSIKPDDKYLQQGEAWRQKMNQTYLDEVAARTKRKREDALRGLERGQKAAADQRAWDYKAAQDALAQQEKNYALGRQAQLDEEARQHRDWQEKFQQSQADRNYRLQAAAQAENRRYHDAMMKEKEAARIAKEKGSSYKTGGKYDTWVDGDGNVYEVNYNKLDYGGLSQLYKELGGKEIYGDPSNAKRLAMIKHIADTLKELPQYGEYLKNYEQTGAVTNRGRTPMPDDVTPPNNQRTGLGWGNGGANSNGKLDW